MERMSSSRTNALKLLYELCAIILLPCSFLIIKLFGDIQTVLFGMFLAPASIFCFIFGFKLTTMTVDNGNIIFSNLFKKKKTEVPLDYIKPHLINSFKLSFGSFAKYSTICYKDTQGKYIKFLVLSPSDFSSKPDIPKSIESLQRELKHMSIINNKMNNK